MIYGGRGTPTKTQGRWDKRLVADNINACWTEWNKSHENKA
jgi:hypothetical protein